MHVFIHCCTFIVWCVVVHQADCESSLLCTAPKTIITVIYSYPHRKRPNGNPDILFLLLLIFFEWGGGRGAIIVRVMVRDTYPHMLHTSFILYYIHIYTCVCFALALSVHLLLHSFFFLCPCFPRMYFIPVFILVSLSVGWANQRARSPNPPYSTPCKVALAGHGHKLHIRLSQYLPDSRLHLSQYLSDSRLHFLFFFQSRSIFLFAIQLFR